MYRSRALAVIEVVLLAAGLAQMLFSQLAVIAVGALSWVVLALVYVVGSLWVARGDHPGDHGEHADEGGRAPSAGSGSRPPGRHPWLRSLSDLTPLLAAATGLIAAIDYLDEPDGVATGASLADDVSRLYLALDRSQALTVLIGVLGWLVLHIGFAQMYERHDQLEAHGGFRFPGTRTPASAEYLYLGMTIGATFATSDVEVRSSRTRWIVMTHTVLAFLYNAVVVGVVVKLLTGG